MSFPSALDTWANMTNTSLLLQDHLGRHNDLQTAIIGLETKVGITSSAVQTTHDYKLSGVALGDKAASKTGVETLTNKTLTTPVVAQISNTGTLTLPTTTDTLVGRVTTDTLTNKTLTVPTITGGVIGLVDNSGAAFNMGQVSGGGNIWRLQLATASLSASGGNGFGTCTFPVALATTAGANVFCCISGPASGLDFGISISHAEIASTTTANVRVNGATGGTVVFLIWGACAS